MTSQSKGGANRPVAAIRSRKLILANSCPIFTESSSPRDSAVILTLHIDASMPIKATALVVMTPKLNTS